jgi:hypothetical protein
MNNYELLKTHLDGVQAFMDENEDLAKSLETLAEPLLDDALIDVYVSMMRAKQYIKTMEFFMKHHMEALNLLNELEKPAKRGRPRKED